MTFLVVVLLALQIFDGGFLHKSLIATGRNNRLKPGNFLNLSEQRIDYETSH